MIKAVAFDFGNTLLKSSFPLSWQDSYRDVITDVLHGIGAEVTPDRIKSGEETLLRYNTRVNPRDYEVDADTIFSEMFVGWGLDNSAAMKTAKDTFASFFLGLSELYPDTLPVLQELKRRNLKTGILTNTAYGLDREYLAKDAVGIMPYIDIFLSSTEVGFRKPHTAGFYRIAEELAVNTSDCMFVGDEEVDITGANASGMVSVFIDRKNEGKQYGQAHTLTTLDEILELV
jgi:putative hydrolase of the HAD superfamily